MRHPYIFKALLKDLEEFAFKGIPDVRGSTVQDAHMLESLVRHFMLCDNELHHQPQCIE